MMVDSTLRGPPAAGGSGYWCSSCRKTFPQVTPRTLAEDHPHVCPYCDPPVLLTPLPPPADAASTSVSAN